MSSAVAAKRDAFVILEKKDLPSRLRCLQDICRDEMVRILKMMGVDPSTTLIDVTAFSELKNVRGGPSTFFRSSTVYVRRGPGKELAVREIVTQKLTLNAREVVVATSSLGGASPQFCPPQVPLKC